MCVYVYMHIYIYMCIYIKIHIYLKELAHMILESNKSPNMWGALECWRTRKASCVMLVPRMPGLRPAKIWYFSLNPKAEKCQSPSLKAVWQEEFSITRGRTISWLQGQHTVVRKIFFTQSPNLNVNFIHKWPHRNTQNNVWLNIWAPHGPIKLIYKINHHICLCQLCGLQILSPSL